jgi:hypothetical protein
MRWTLKATMKRSEPPGADCISINVELIDNWNHEFIQVSGQGSLLSSNDWRPSGFEVSVRLCQVALAQSSQLAEFKLNAGDGVNEEASLYSCELFPEIISAYSSGWSEQRPSQYTLGYWHEPGGFVARGVLTTFMCDRSKAAVKWNMSNEAIFRPVEGHRVTTAVSRAATLEQNYGKYFRTANVS